MKILIVDDDPNFREVFSKILHSMGATVVEANTGQQGVESLLSETPDIVVLDIMLPDKDGFHVLKDMQTRSKVPVVATTAYHSYDTFANVKDGGFNGYLRKPFSDWGNVIVYLKQKIEERLA